MFIEAHRSTAAPQQGAMSVATAHGTKATWHIAPRWGAAVLTAAYL